MAKSTLKNCKNLANLIEWATLGSLTQLATLPEFSLLDIPTENTDAKSALQVSLALQRADVLTVADQEALRIVQLSEFRAETLLEHASKALNNHSSCSEFDENADILSRLIWLRIYAYRIFEQIETFFLTHHFHGHKKLVSFSIAEYEELAFVWNASVQDKLHDAIFKLLKLDEQSRHSCEIVHFEIEEETAEGTRRLHYLVVYHPGAMKQVRQMKGARRDLLRFIPALEATLIYDPDNKEVHVLTDKKPMAEKLANTFAQVGFERPLSEKPVDALVYELSMFKDPIDLKALHLPGVIIEDAWVSSMTVSLGHTAHHANYTMSAPVDIWQAVTQAQHGHNPFKDCRFIHDVSLCFTLRFLDETASRSLAITVTHRGGCDVLTHPDPRLRRCGETLLKTLGVLRRVEPAALAESDALLRAELKLLDLEDDECDGYLLRSLHLPADDLLNKGLLHRKRHSHFITLPVIDDEGQRAYQRLLIQSDNASSWAYDALLERRIDLQASELTRYTIKKAYLRERLIALLSPQLNELCRLSEPQEPWVIGYYVIHQQRLPVVLVTRLWDSAHAARLDTQLRQMQLGLCIVLCTTSGVVQRYLGSGVVVPLELLLEDIDGRPALCLARVESDVLHQQTAASAGTTLALFRDDNRSARLVGPWPSPWLLTKREWIEVVELLITAWNSHKSKCSKAQLEKAAGVSIRSMREFFRGEPSWGTYIRGADSPSNSRYWELNIGQPAYLKAAQNLELPL